MLGLSCHVAHRLIDPRLEVLQDWRGHTIHSGGIQGLGRAGVGLWEPLSHSHIFRVTSKMERMAQNGSERFWQHVFPTSRCRMDVPGRQRAHPRRLSFWEINWAWRSRGADTPDTCPALQNLAWMRGSWRNWTSNMQSCWHRSSSGGAGSTWMLSHTVSE